MCCFSQPVISVNATKIFARPGVNGHQYVVYSMALEAKQDLAMILPLPVKPTAGEPDFNFINLKEYPTFFEDMLVGFPAFETRSLSDGAAANSLPSSDALKVY